MNHRLASCFALLCALAGSVDAQEVAQRRALIVPISAAATWEDLAFLAAVPAASAATNGKPIVLAIDSGADLPAETKDFFARYRPDALVWVGGSAERAVLDGVVSEHLPAETLDAAACALADRFFVRSELAVICSDDDYASALAASALAARVKAPLLYCSAARLSESAQAVLKRIGARELLLVGNLGSFVIPAPSTVERLRTSVDVGRWFHKRGLPVGALYAAAPADRSSGRGRKLSLAAATLAAGRQGAVVTIGTAVTTESKVAEVRAEFDRFRKASGAGVESLCLVALPDAIPMEVVVSGSGVDTDPPSDHGYGDIDADPFLELDVGRFVAEDGFAATLQAARSLAYEELIAPSFAGRFALAEWERACAPLFANVGFERPAMHEGEKPVEQDSALTSVSVLVHNAHSSWSQLGATYVHDSRVLLAPCIVETGGCSPASLDQDPMLHSVAMRLLRNGAIAFVGNVRRAVAQNELYRSEFWNAVLAGKSLGRAHRDARNRVLLAVLAKDENAQGLYRYQLHNVTLYGDPALVLHLPSAPKSAPASVEVRGRDVFVKAPAAWWRTEQFVPADWNYTASPVLYAWRGAGVGVESSWDADNKRNREILVYTAEVRTKRRVSGLTPVKAPPAPLGWDGRHVIDEHPDGSRSVFFRVRLIDVDMATGDVLQRAEQLHLRLE